MTYRLRKIVVIVSSAAIMFAPGAFAVSGEDTITTIAGTGEAGFSGDGGKAISAQLNFPLGVAVDSAGNLYVADTSSNRIRKVTPAGVITTVAGTGAAGFSGDGGQATSAQLDSPRGIAVDSAGSLYITDTYNRRIRKVTPTGVITTVAGTGTIGFSGDGGQATSATLNDPFGVAVDSAGNLYIGDTFNNRVRKVTPAGVITTVAGTGAVGYDGDGIPATAAQLNQPFGVAVDSAGNLYIADQVNRRVRKVTAAGVITTVAGTGSVGFSGDGGQATSAQLNSPLGVAVDSAGNLYVSDPYNNRIRKVTPAGVITTVAGTGKADFSGDGGKATSAELDDPWGVAVDSAGRLYIADRDNQRVRVVGGGSAGSKATCKGQPATIVGTSGPDVLKGTPGPDVIAALGGDDVVHGRNGDDLICLGPGNDRGFGDNGNDRIFGQAGRDVLTGGPGLDTGDGGTGSDICRVEQTAHCP